MKNEQQLTIDYQTFSSVLIELLSECLADEDVESPSKRLELNIQTLRSTLSIVEPRRIRNITELKLYFTPADDAQQKAYLATYVFVRPDSPLNSCFILIMVSIQVAQKISDDNGRQGAKNEIGN